MISDLLEFVGELLADGLVEVIIDPPGFEGETKYPKLEAREPYPPEGPLEILTPIDDAKMIEKRKAADKEFWETQQ
jgi:hypothetical protein